MRLLLASATPLASIAPPQARPARRAMRSTPDSSVASIFTSVALYWRNANDAALTLNLPSTALRPSSATGASAGDGPLAGVAAAAGLSGASTLLRSRLSKRACAWMLGLPAKAAWPLMSNLLVLSAPSSFHDAALASARALPRTASCSGCRPGSASVAFRSSASIATAPLPALTSRSAFSVPSTLRCCICPCSASDTPGSLSASNLPLGAPDWNLPFSDVGPLSLDLPRQRAAFQRIGVHRQLRPLERQLERHVGALAAGERELQCVELELLAGGAEQQLLDLERRRRQRERVARAALDVELERAGAQRSAVPAERARCGEGEILEAGAIELGVELHAAQRAPRSCRGRAPAWCCRRAQSLIGCGLVRSKFGAQRHRRLALVGQPAGLQRLQRHAAFERRHRIADRQRHVVERDRADVEAQRRAAARRRLVPPACWDRPERPSGRRCCSCRWHRGCRARARRAR